MEKQTPHCKLSIVKAMIEAGNVRSTKSALISGEAMGFAFDDIIDVVMALTPTDFYKSMTTAYRSSGLAGCLSANHISR